MKKLPLKNIVVSILLLIAMTSYIYWEDIVDNNNHENYYLTNTALAFEISENNSAILAKNTPLTYVRSFSEGFSVFKMSIYLDGSDYLPIKQSDSPLYRKGSFVTSPIWIRDIEADDIPHLVKNYPLTKEELKDILKEQNISKAELLRMVDMMEH